MAAADAPNAPLAPTTVKTLHWYIIRELALPTILSALFFTLILMVLRLFDEADLLLQGGVSGDIVLRLMGIFAATVITQTAPMALLMGILVGVGRLAAENEVLAMRGAGLSLLRTFYPVLLLSILLAAGLVWMNNYGVPRMFRQVDQVRYQIQFDLLTNLQPGRFYSELGGGNQQATLFYETRATSIEGSTEVIGDHDLVMEGVAMRLKAKRRAFFSDAPTDGDAPEEEVKAYDREVEFLIFSEYGIVRGDPGNQSLRIRLVDGAIFPMDSANQPEAARIGFAAMDYDLQAGEDISELAEQSPQEMVLEQLVAHLRNPPDGEPHRIDDGERVLRGIWRAHFLARNELLQRFTLPLAALAFALIAIPLGIEIRPRAKSLSFVIAIGLVTFYYALYTFGRRVGAMTPEPWIAALALMTPNLVIAAVGIWLFRRASRR